ncbi:MAG: helix-turn-helix domain-containing protein [bacterium]
MRKKISIHPVQFSRYERGQSVSSIEVVQKIADALEVSIDQIVYGDQDNKAEQSISDRELLSMFKKVQLLSERQKETVKDFLSSYILKNDLKQKLA